MRKTISISMIFLAVIFSGQAQVSNDTAAVKFKPSGSAIGNVFLNYHYDLTKDEDQRSAFAIDRAYLGYKYDFSKNISARVMYDAVYDKNTKAFSAFLKNANIDWTVIPQVKLTIGMMGLKQFDTQEKIWGYRYIMKTFVDEYGLGTSADVGLNIELPLHKMVTVNAFFINGEGFKSIQDEFGMHRVGGNIVVRPFDGLVTKFHYDVMGVKDEYTPKDTTSISNISAFVGYENKLIRVGLEYNILNNGTGYKEFADNHKLGGISLYGAYIISPKFEVFGRYDKVKSNKLEGESNVWNIEEDGSLILGGVQYKAAKGVNIALNYRTFILDAEGSDPFSAIYLNFGFAF